MIALEECLKFPNNMIKRILFLIILTVSITSYGQDYRFGKVDEIDFERITPEGEEEPPAEVLFRKESISFRIFQGNGLTQKRSIQERIKINTEEGLEYATKKIRLYNENVSRRERVKFLKGYTYSLNDGKVKDVKLRSSGEFEEEINEYWKMSSFTMPDVKVGSIIEFEYDIDSPFTAIDDVVLQYDIPIRKLDLRVEMIEYFTYNVHFNPRAAYVPDLSRSVERDKVRTSTSERSGGNISQPVKTTFSSQQYELNNQVLTIDTTDIPALKEEPMSGGMTKYRAKIVFELAAISFPREPVKYLSVDWQSVVKSIYDHEMFGDQLEEKPFYLDELTESLDGVIAPIDKVEKVLEFVKDKIKWNGYYGITSQNGLKDAYNDGSGNVADVNLLLTSMLKSQNIEAYPILISTRDNGIPLFPTRDGFNYVATVVKIKDELILLDATDANLPVGNLPLRAMNWQGRAIKQDGSSFEVDLTPKEHSKEMVMSNVVLNEDLSITGKANKRLTDQMAYSYRNDYSTRSEVDIIKYLQDDTPGFEISNLQLKNVKKVKQPVGFSYDVKLSNAAEKIGDKIYLTPLLNEINKENPFKMEDRKLPVVIGYPVMTKAIVNLEIPEGYEVVSLPESIQYNYNEGKGSYRFVTSQIGNKITVAADFKMNDAEVLPVDYPKWKEFFTAIVAKDAEKIVLKKI